MKYILLIITISMLYSTHGNCKTVHLYGSLKEFKMDRLDMKYQGIGAEIFSNNDMQIILDDSGSFDIRFDISKPTYYNIGSNVLYIKPGNDLEVNLGRVNERAFYTGIGELENNYLKGINWSDSKKVGYDFNEKRTFDEIKTIINRLAEKRIEELVNTNSVDSYFVEIEKIRVLAQKYNSYVDYFLYASLSNWDDSKDVKKEKKKSFYLSNELSFQPIIKEISAKEEYLVLPDVREILLECMDMDLFNLKPSKLLQELNQVKKISENMDIGIRKSDYKDYEKYVKKIKNKEIQISYKDKMKSRLRLMEGQPAPEIFMKDVDGNKFLLSDFKGEVLFIDFWATWCLPCLFQMPHVKELSEKYPSINFIAVSIDQDFERWKKKILSEETENKVKEYITNVYDVQESWEISSIPRFLLIDKDFKIITAFAPRPSDKDLIEELLNLYVN